MKISNVLWGILIVFMAFHFLKIGSAKTPTTYQEVSNAQALQMYDKKEAIVLDVRTYGEWSEGHIPNALHIPLDELERRIHEVPTEEKVLVICRSGSRSYTATNLLHKNGWTNTINVLAGMSKWQGEITSEKK